MTKKEKQTRTNKDKQKDINMNTNGIINKKQEQYTKDEQKHTTNT